MLYSPTLDGQRLEPAERRLGVDGALLQRVAGDLEGESKVIVEVISHKPRVSPLSDSRPSNGSKEPTESV